DAVHQEARVVERLQERAALGDLERIAVDGDARHLELEAPGERAALLVYVHLEVEAEVAQQALDRPGRSVGERADRLALHLRGDVEQDREVLLAAGAALDP